MSAPIPQDFIDVAVHAHLGTESAPFIGIEPMIGNKRATGRTKDLADAEALEEIRARRKP